MSSSTSSVATSWAGWSRSTRMGTRLAERLIAATCLKQSIGPQQLTIHADRGAPMRSKLVARAVRRPHHRRQPLTAAREQRQSVFRSAVPHLQIPTGVSRHASAPSNTRAPSAHDLFTWYNDAHHHSGLSYLTPAAVHYGRAAGDPRRASPHAAGRVCGPSRAVRAGATTSRNAAHGRVDQSAADTDPPGCPRRDDRHPGRPAAWADPPVTSHH